MARDDAPSVLLVMICLRCHLGGAEKRYARTFEMLVRRTAGRHKLLINRAMWELLQSAGIGVTRESVAVLDPPRHMQSRRRTPWLILWYIWKIIQAIRRYRPAIIHPLLTGVYFSLPAILLFPRLRLVMSTYSYEIVSYRDRFILGIPVGATLKQLALRRSRAIDALSSSIRRDWIARGIDERKIFVAPGSFTDYSQCHPAPAKKKWITFVARLVAIKNPLLLAEAIPAVLAAHPDAHFHFLGEGPLQAEISARVMELGVAEHVTIQFSPRPTEILNVSSIFVSLQTQENYPSQSLLEAMACGNAIVATDVGETWRLVDETNGIRVPPTPQAVAEAIIRLLDDPRLPQYRRASRERALRDHSPERFFTYILDVYRAAVQ